MRVLVLINFPHLVCPTSHKKENTRETTVWKHFQFLCTMLVIGSAIVAGFAIHSRAATPGIINYQGRVQSAAGVDFTGNGLFKFALVDGSGSTTYWSNDLTSANGSEPTAAV